MKSEEGQRMYSAISSDFFVLFLFVWLFFLPYKLVRVIKYQINSQEIWRDLQMIMK